MVWQRLKERVLAKRPKVAGNQLEFIQGEREIMNGDDLMCQPGFSKRVDGGLIA